MRTTLKNVLSGKVVDRTFNAGTKVETATVDKRTMQYLYPTAKTTSSWISRPSTRSPSRRHVGDAAKYLLPEAEVRSPCTRVCRSTSSCRPAWC